MIIWSENNQFIALLILMLIIIESIMEILYQQSVPTSKAREILKVRTSRKWQSDFKRFQYVDLEELSENYEIRKQYLRLKRIFEEENAELVEGLNEKRLGSLYGYIKQSQLPDEFRESTHEKDLIEYNFTIGYKPISIKVKHFSFDVCQEEQLVNVIGVGASGRIVPIPQQINSQMYNEKIGQQNSKCFKFIRLDDKRSQEEEERKYKNEQIRKIVHEFGMLMVAEDLGVGPQVFADENGYHIKVFNNCICFIMEKCTPLEQHTTMLLENGSAQEIAQELSTRLYDQILHCLYVLHWLKIVHKDVKHQNIVYSQKRGKFILCDFELAKRLPYLPTDSYCLLGYEGTRDYSHNDLKYTTDFKFANLYLNDFYSVYLVAEPKQILRKIEKNDEYGKKNNVIANLGLSPFLKEIEQRMKRRENAKEKIKSSRYFLSLEQFENYYFKSKTEGQLYSSCEWVLELKLRTYGYNQQISEYWSQNSTVISADKFPNREEYEKYFIKQHYKKFQSEQFQNQVTQQFLKDNIDHYKQVSQQLLCFQEDENLITCFENIIINVSKRIVAQKRLVVMNYFKINKDFETGQQKAKFQKLNQSIDFQMFNQFAAIAVLIFTHLQWAVKTQNQHPKLKQLFQQCEKVSIFESNKQLFDQMNHYHKSGLMFQSTDLSFVSSSKIEYYIDDFTNRFKNVQEKHQQNYKALILYLERIHIKQYDEMIEFAYKPLQNFEQHIQKFKQLQNYEKAEYLTKYYQSKKSATDEFVCKLRNKYSYIFERRLKQKIWNRNTWSLAHEYIKVGDKKQPLKIIFHNLFEQYDRDWFYLLEILHKDQQKQSCQDNQEKQVQLTEYEQSLIDYAPVFKVIEKIHKIKPNQVQKYSYAKIQTDRFKTLQKHQKIKHISRKKESVPYSDKDTQFHNYLLCWKMVVTLQLNNEDLKHKCFTIEALTNKIYFKFPFPFGLQFLEQTFGFYYNGLFYNKCQKTQICYFASMLYCTYKLSFDFEQYQVRHYIQDLDNISDLIQKTLFEETNSLKQFEKQNKIVVLFFIELMKCITKSVFQEQQVEQINQIASMPKFQNIEAFSPREVANRIFMTLIKLQESEECDDGMQLFKKVLTQGTWSGWESINSCFLVASSRQLVIRAPIEKHGVKKIDLSNVKGKGYFVQWKNFV